MARWLVFVACSAPVLAAAYGGPKTAPPVDRWVAQTAPRVPQPRQEGLTTDVAEPQDRDHNVLEHVLNLPAVIIELLFSPLYPITYSFERWALHQRIFDLLTSDDLSLAVVPVADLFNRSSVGLGAAVLYNEPFGSEDRLIAFALLRTNLDREFSVTFNRRIPFLDGRKLSLGAAYDFDHDLRYFGLGVDRALGVERLIFQEAIDLSLGMTLLDPAMDLDGEVELAYRFRRLEEGVGDSPGLTSEDVISAPAGFGDALSYPEVNLRINWDSRDSIGRTTRGLLGKIETSFTQDIEGQDTGGIRATVAVSAFFPLALVNRVLVLSGGASIAFPLSEGGEIPLHHLVNLGGSETLRGFVSDRFVDRIGWWSSAEYRYYTFALTDTGFGISTLLFVDVGNVARGPEEFFDGPIGWSLGFGFRIEHDLLTLASFQVGFSREGGRISVRIGELP